MLSRRNVLKTSGVAAVVAITGIATDAVAFQANDPVLRRIDLTLPRLPQKWDGLRIAQLSDFHYDPDFSVIPIQKAVKIINSLHVDLVALTGDFVTQEFFHRHIFGTPHPVLAVIPCAEVLSGLRSKYGSFAVLGNHDVWCGAETIIDKLQAKNIPVLRNSSSVLENGGQRLWLAGVDDVYEGAPDLQKTLSHIPDEDCVILLCHEPDYADTVRGYSVDLQLSGHSHGGQIRLPLIGPPYLPELGRKYPIGMYNFGHLTLYTNVGIGTIRIPARWNCPPEITLFTLHSGAERKG